MCVILCFFSALSRRVGALQISNFFFFFFFFFLRTFRTARQSPGNEHNPYKKPRNSFYEFTHVAYRIWGMFVSCVPVGGGGGGGEGEGDGVCVCVCVCVCIHMELNVCFFMSKRLFFFLFFSSFFMHTHYTFYKSTQMATKHLSFLFNESTHMAISICLQSTCFLNFCFRFF